MDFQGSNNSKQINLLSKKENGLDDFTFIFFDYPEK